MANPSSERNGLSVLAQRHPDLIVSLPDWANEQSFVLKTGEKNELLYLRGLREDIVLGHTGTAALFGPDYTAVDDALPTGRPILLMLSRRRGQAEPLRLTSADKDQGLIILEPVDDRVDF